MTTAPDLTSYHAVHAALRGGAHALADAASRLHVGGPDPRRVKAFGRYWKGYAGEVLAHHTVEDEFFFPALVGRVAHANELIARTDAEHGLLDELMDASAAGVAQLEARGQNAPLVHALGQLADLMDRHLDFEDAQVLPLFERHFSAEEYKELDAKAVKSIGLGAQAAFTVPFVVSFMSAEALGHMMAEAPAPLRVLYRLTRGRYARLSIAALGRVPGERVADALAPAQPAEPTEPEVLAAAS